MQQQNLMSFFGSKKGTAQKDSAVVPTVNVVKTTDSVSPYLNTILQQTNEDLPFATLVSVLESIESTTKRLAIGDYLAAYFSEVIKKSPTVLLPSVYLCINAVGPQYEGLELGLGEALLIKSIANATGRTTTKIKQEADTLGDLGMVAEQSKGTQTTMFSPKPLTVKTVFKTLREIALTSGANSVNRKLDKIKFLFVSSQAKEVKFIMRMLEGKLRIGLASQTVLVSLAHAFTKKEQDRPQSVAILKSVYSQIPNYEMIIPKIYEHGIENLENFCKITPGTPLKPMLAHPTKSISQVLSRFENIPFTCEFKYDGERAQIHRLENGSIAIFSRNLENMSQKYPDIVSNVAKFTKPETSSFIIDCEVVAWDVKEQKILPFQVLSTRKRKDVEVNDIAVQVCLFAFDILYLNSESLLKNTLQQRREKLKSAFIPQLGEFNFATSMDGQSVEDIEQFLETSVKGNCEGLMIKTLVDESSYEPSRRSRNWLKVKKDYVNGVGDSLDLVVIGGYQGRGKRTGHFGGYLLAIYDPKSEKYQAICKIGTGFSDQDFEEQAQYFKDKIIPNPKPYYLFDESVKADVWFEPAQVWEVKAADFSISPIYLAARGLVDPTRGISLRFPRFLRIREDKTPEMSSTPAFVADLYRQQANVQKNEDFEDDDDY